MADMNDLEDAIKVTANECVTNAPFGELPMDVEEKSDEIPMKGDRHEYVLHEFVIGAFEDGYYPGEIKGIYDETLSIDFLEKISFKGDDRSFWKWPIMMAENYIIEKPCVLPIRPCLEIAVQYTTKRRVIFELINNEFIEKFM